MREAAAHRERRCDGDDDDGEIDDQTIKSKSVFRPPEQKRHHNLFRMRPGSKAALSAPW